MRISRLLVVSYVYCMLLGCSTAHHTEAQAQYTTPTTPAMPATRIKKNPIAVSFYPKGKNPGMPYTVIGEAAVSKYNASGIKRQDAVIHDAMRTLAASMGGDAVIDVKHTNQSVVGQVVAWNARVFV